MKPAYRAEQVGSLLRPPELLRTRAGFAEGRITEQELRRAEDQAISEALAKQREIGVDIATDGEMRRGSWLTDMAEAVEGFVPEKVMLDWKGPGGRSEASTANAVGGKLRKVRKLTGRELPFLQQSGLPFKITLPAPSNFVVSSYKRGVSDKFYATPADLLQDLSSIIRDEIQWLSSEGVEYVQFDAPYYSHYLDPRQREHMRAEGRDPDEELESGIAADNLVMEGAPRDRLTFALHVCRGNSRSRWYTEGSYEAVAEKLFQTLHVDRFLLEYDTERSGGFEPLRFIPQGKTVVLGLLTTKEARLESLSDLRRRIEEAARYVPLEN
ncbi:MAG: hypothetical protein JO099_24865, partial [Acidobacteriia bacterium]|nr:hypothetical protein [Terriglobia bacterium]